MQKKSSTAKRAPRKGKPGRSEQGTRTNALRLFKLINDENVEHDVRRHLFDYCADVVNDAPVMDTWRNQSLFVSAFVEGWQQKSTAHARRSVGMILDRLDGGAPVEQIIHDFRASLDGRRAEREAEDSAPEQLRRELARNLAEIMANPETPAALYNDIGEFVCAMSSEIGNDYWHSPEMLERSLNAYIACEEKRTQKGGAR